jgi:hypothetical protein
LTRSGPSFRCTVHDQSAAAPRRRHYAADAVTGRGLALVEALAVAWGTDREGDGKCVWFEMRMDAAQPARDESSHRS